MNRIALAKSVAPRASAETLRGDWLARLRLAVDFNNAADRMDAEGKAA